MELRDFLLQGLKNSSSTPQAQQKAATIARSIPQTAPPAQTVSRSSSAPKGFNRLRSLWSRGFDQANIFDNNLTWKQRTPTQSKSVLDQTGQAGGQLTRATVGNLTKMVNTGLAQVPQVIDTGRMLAADFTNNDQAWKNANEAALKDNQRFQEGKGGLLNVGTLYNAQDARNGNWTGVRKIVQGTGMAGLDVASLMTGANVGASVAKNGVGAGLKAEAGNLAKSGLLNTVQGGAQAYQDGSRNVGDIAKAALVSGALGTAGDVGLGLAGAAAGNAAKVVTTKLVTNRTPLNNAGSTPIGGPLVPIPKKIVDKLSGKQDPLESLKQEARKYKSAEEFVNSKVNMYHGTPYDFDKFDSSKIMTGEAENAMGRGLYMTDSPNVADYYKRTVTKKPVVALKNVDGTDVDAKTLGQITFLKENKLAELPKDQQVALIKQQINAMENLVKQRNASPDSGIGKLLASYKKIDPDSISVSKYNNRVVKAYGDSSSFIDTKAPLSNEQVAKLKKALGDNYLDWNNIKDGQDLYFKLARKRKNPEKVLSDAGIKGIKYPVGELSAKQYGGSNYVFFDDKNLLTEKQLTDLYNQAHTETKAPTPQAPQPTAPVQKPKPVDPTAALKQEAPQGTFYKGFKKDGSSTASSEGDAFYITPHENIAKTYDEGVGVKQYKFSPDTKVVDWKSPEYKAVQEKHMVQVKGGEPGYRKPDYNAINAELKAQGYDAITFKTPDGDSPQVAVINQKKVIEIKNQPGVHDSLADNLPNQTGIKNQADNVFSLTQQSPESRGIIPQKQPVGEVAQQPTLQDAFNGKDTRIKTNQNSRMGRKSVPENQNVDLQKPNLQQPKKLSTAQQPEQLSQEVLTSLNKTASSGEIIPQLESIIKGGKVKQGKLRQRITTNDKYPQPVRDMAEGTYVVKDNKTTIKHAKDLIRTDIGLAEERALHPKNAVDVQINAELFNHYSQLGKTAEANNLLKGLDETNMGQMVQILSQYDKTSPQGIVRFAQNTIKNYNKTVPDGKKLQISDSQIKSLTDKAIKIQKMPDGKPRNLASRQLIEDVNKLIPSTITDKAITLWKAGLLTSPRTTMRNVLGNTIHGITEIAKDAPAALNDRLLQAKTGSRTLTMTTKGVGSGAKEGFNVAKDVMKFGFDPEESISKFDIKKVNWGDGPMGKAGKVYTDTVFNFLGAQDKPFYHAAFARSLYDQAGAIAINSGKKGNKQFIENLVKNPNTQMLKTATQDASVATFKDVNVLGKIARDVKGRLGKSEAGKAASEIIAPFTGVPSSIAGQILQYSPVGLAKGIVKDAKVLSGKVPELQRQASQEIGRGVVGSGLLGIGAYLTANGLMTGNPKDANEARQWQLEGKQANSVLINGKWRSINSVGPEALVVLAGSKIQSGASNGEGASSIAGNLGKDFTQQTFLQGVQGPLNAITDPSRYGKQYINQQVASVVPNIVKDTAKALDSTQRETNSVSDALKAAIPGVRNDLLPKQDALGSPVKQEPTGLNAYVDLFNSKTPVKGNVVDELSRLYSAGQSATPPKQDAKTSINGVKVELTPKQRNELEKNIGTSTNTGFDGFMKTDQYKALNDEQKKQVLDDFRQDITTVEKKKYAIQNQLGAYAPGSTDNEKPTTVRQNKIIDGSITIDEYIKKTSTTGKTTGKKSSYKDKYQSLLNESNDPKNGWSDITRAVKEKELKKLSVQKDYDDDTVALYGMSKADAYNYLTRSPKGKELADKLIAYDNALFDAGLSKYKKFKNGLAPAAKKASKGKGGKGRKGSGKARKGKKVASKYSYKLFAFNSSPSSTSKSLRDVLKKATIKG